MAKLRKGQHDEHYRDHVLHTTAVNHRRTDNTMAKLTKGQHDEHCRDHVLHTTAVNHRRTDNTMAKLRKGQHDEHHGLCSVHHVVLFLIWPLYCLFFCDLRL
jgi:ribosomal protein L33